MLLEQSHSSSVTSLNVTRALLPANLSTSLLLLFQAHWGGSRCAFASTSLFYLYFVFFLCKALLAVNFCSHKQSSPLRSAPLCLHAIPLHQRLRSLCQFGPHFFSQYRLVFSTTLLPLTVFSLLYLTLFFFFLHCAVSSSLCCYAVGTFIWHLHLLILKSINKMQY